jgi:hypothetical protein
MKDEQKEFAAKMEVRMSETAEARGSVLDILCDILIDIHESKKAEASEKQEGASSNGKRGRGRIRDSC